MNNELTGRLVWRLYEGVCPVLCSGHGRYIHGSCRCEPGWKGAECNVATTDCELADCNGRGKCADGVCVCNVGFKGDFCEQDRSCSAFSASDTETKKKENRTVE
ncbi:Teneurin-2 [Araneus ventricosus]|uniref:Teneurin-2 n=1 Tax=Araneus ventricosus TaxID=182803 RepID=A0A4Y2CTI3_ARAVE|nr:Teneurin-2 [Araneus ventricosus]